MPALALVGLSGVGKSTLLASRRDTCSFLHVQASVLIKLEQAARGADVASSEALRLGPAIDNQTLLISGFLRATCGETRPVVFDGHTVIDGVSGLIEIGSDVFGQLGIRHIMVLVADPSEIARRREMDVGRVRPSRTDAEIATHQAPALEVANRIACELSINIDVITESQSNRLWEIIEIL